MPKIKNTSVNALAGTGKTWTMEQAFRQMAGERLPSTASPEQAEIWKSIGNNTPRTRAVMAFNRSIKDEWRNKKIADLQAYTTFGFGLRILQMNNMKFKGDPEEFKTDMLLEKYEDKPVESLPIADVLNTRRMVQLARLTLTDPNPDALEALADEYGINFNERLAEWIPALLKLHEKHTDIIDYTDMVWLPAVKRLKLRNPIDFLGIDEVQDLNAAQQVLILSNARRFMVVGDRRQAIYQFAGADEHSFDNLEQYLEKSATGLNILPLTVTRRCCKAVVRFANELVPELKALPDAVEGSVDTSDWEDFQHNSRSFTSSDFVICRRNAPLVATTLQLIARRKPARMIGRDFGRSCMTFISENSRGAEDTATIASIIREKIKQQEDIWSRKKFVLDRTKEAFYDMTTSALVFCGMCKTYEEIKSTIQEIFLDDKEAADKKYIRFSSIHRAKGLEAQRVHFLEANRTGVPYTKIKDGKTVQVNPEQVDLNLRYVGVTRAQNQLTMVEAAPDETRR